MGATQQGLSGYRSRVTELLGAGEPFGTVEKKIDDVADLTSDQKAALWLFAFSLQDGGGHMRDARRAHVAGARFGETG